MQNYIFKKVNEDPDLNSAIWADVEKAELSNDNFCTDSADKFTVTAQGVCSVRGMTIHFESNETNPVTKYSHANQPAWTDSCVEFFFAPCEDDNKTYLNFEQSLGGALLIQKGPDAADRTYIPHTDDAFRTEKEITETGWKIQFYIPFGFIDKHYVTMKKHFKGNFNYCCESKGIYLNWNKIENPFPAFHKPEFFANMTLGMSTLDRIEAECIKYGYNVYDMVEMTDDGVDCRSYLPSEPAHWIYSVTKCFTSVLFGTLRDKGLVNENDKIAKYLSEYFPEDVDPKWYDVTCADVLHHRTGGSGGGHFNKAVESRDMSADYLTRIFEDKLTCTIGKEIVYCESNYYIISRIIEKVSGMKLDEYAQKTLFTPWNMEEYAWGRCPQGHSFGGDHLVMRTRDMAKLGWMYAHNGIYEGKRYLSEDWIKKAVDVINVDENGDYGYAVQHTTYMTDKEFYLVGAGDQTVIWRFGKPQVIAYNAAGAGGHLGLLKFVVDMMRED